jgi:hypothetical protein
VAKLQAADWKVLRVWSHESPENAAKAVSFLVIRTKAMRTKAGPDSVRQR